MQLIIDGATASLRETYVLKLFPTPPTIHLILKKDKSTISIAAVRELLNQLATTTNQDRVVWIQEANDLTREAANALLKVLEEPPTKTNFVLTLNNQKSLLPTIRSRCSYLHLPQTTSTLQSTTELQAVKTLMQQKVADRLNYLPQLGKDRQALLNWFDNLLVQLAQTLSRTHTQKGRIILAQLIKNSLNTRESLTQNGNLTLVIGNFLLSLPRLKN